MGYVKIVPWRLAVGTTGTLVFVLIFKSVYILTRLPSASVQLQDFTVLLLSLHCGTLNAHASIVQMYIMCMSPSSTQDIALGASIST